MKKNSYTLLLLAVIALIGCSMQLNAQTEFKKEWECKVSVENKWNDQKDDLSLILIGDLKEIEMVDGAVGKSLWKFNVKEKLGVKSMEDWFFLWAKEGDPVEIVYKKPKEDSKTSVFLNPRTGEIEQSITLENLKDKSNQAARKNPKTLFATSTFDAATNTNIRVTYKDKLMKSANGSMMELTVSASGGNNWTAHMKGKCVMHLCDMLLSSSEPEVMVNVMVMHGKVFVVYEGITVFDLKSGNELWSTTFDNVQVSAGLRALQEIGRSAMPIAGKDAVYLCDFTKGEKAIKKLDINTGNVLWKSDKLNSDDVVSQLFLVDNCLVAKFGGIIRKEKFVPNANGGLGDGTYKVYYDFEGKSDIKGYDTNTGKELWDSEKISDGDKFSKSECSIYEDAGKIIACSDKFFTVIDPIQGKIIAKGDLGSKEIGKAKSIFKYQSSFIVEGEEGIASFDISAQRKYAVNTDKCIFTEFRGNAFLVWIGKSAEDMNEFIRFDLDNGKIYGKLKGTYRPCFDRSGDYFIRYKDNVITKFKTI